MTEARRRAGPPAERDRACAEAAASAGCGPSPKVLKLERRRYLLWASVPTEARPFEASRVVDGPLQAACATAPLCPEEAAAAGGSATPEPARPLAKASPRCPYAYRTKEECYRARNAEALGSSLWDEGEVRTVRNFLRALGYAVREEAISEQAIDGRRILLAHSQLSEDHDVRFVAGPGRREIVLVRDPGRRG